MKRFIEGQARQQVTLLPECLVDYVDEDNPVRTSQEISQCFTLSQQNLASLHEAYLKRPS